jgi:hypothetical protein
MVQVEECLLSNQEVLSLIPILPYSDIQELSSTCRIKSALYMITTHFGIWDTSFVALGIYYCLNLYYYHYYKRLLL